MGKASKKIALIESKCDFNIDGMKLFRFHSYSDTDFLRKKYLIHMKIV